VASSRVWQTGAHASRPHMTKAPNEILETAARLLSVPESSADGLRALANFAAQQRNASMMFDSLRALWRRGDATMKDQLALARAYFLLGDLHRALILLNRLSREADVDAELLTLRAMTAVFAGRPAMALREAAAASEALDSTDANGMERRAADWLVNYLAGFLERPGRSRPYGRAALIHRWRGLKPPIETPVIALLDYRSPDLHGASRNLGDWIQTVAALRHVARLGGLEWTYDDPDMAVVLQRTAATWIDEERIAINGKAHLAVLDRDFPWPAAHRFPERPVWAIYNGWFCHSAFGRMAAMPAPENLQPLLVSFHLARAEDLTGAVVEWLRKFEPVGCRDWSTVYWLANQGVQCFFSGCLTLTLASATAIGGEGERLAVDVEPEQGERAIGQTANSDKPSALRTPSLGSGRAGGIRQSKAGRPPLRRIDRCERRPPAPYERRIDSAARYGAASDCSR